MRNLEDMIMKNDKDEILERADSFFYGINRPVDHWVAARLYKTCVSEGNVFGYYQLANCYEYGLGVYHDKDKAFHYFSLAALKGHPDAFRRAKLLANN
jgi:TPR repeat protein